MKRHITFALLFAAALTAQAQQGGISSEMLNQIKQSYQATPTDKAIRNALGGTSINTLALNQENQADFDTHFSNKVLSKGITDQRSSGRCWLFTGLNVLRSQMIAKYGLDEMEFSQNYCFFYDQLEKSNLFLQGIIDTREKPMDDKMVEWLFKHPLSDGGQFTGVSDIIGKYGLVPKSAMVKGVLFIQRLLAGPGVQCRGSSGPHTSTHPRSPAHRTSRRCSPRSEYQQPGFVCHTHSMGRIAGIYDGADPFFAGQALYHIQYKDLIVEVKPCFCLVPEQVRIQP